MGVLPVRVANVTPSSVPSAVSAPHEVMRRSASKTREVNVPDGIGARLMSSTVSGVPLRVEIAGEHAKIRRKGRGLHRNESVIDVEPNLGRVPLDPIVVRDNRIDVEWSDVEPLVDLCSAHVRPRVEPKL